MCGFSRFSVVFAAIFAIGLSANAPFARAGVFTLSTDAGANNNGLPVSAEAIVTTSNGTVQVQLTNMEDPTSAMGQVLTGFTFKLSNGATTGNVTSGSADVVVVHGDGTIQDLGTNPIFGNVVIGGTSYQGWTLGNGPYLSVFGSGTPNFGDLDYQTHYNANGSIAGNSPHNPFSRGTMDFVMNVSGVTANTSITNGTFQFGTNQSGGYIVTVPDNLSPSPTPEPASLACWCLLGISAIGLHKFRTRSPISNG